MNKRVNAAGAMMQDAEGRRTAEDNCWTGPCDYQWHIWQKSLFWVGRDLRVF